MIGMTIDQLELAYKGSGMTVYYATNPLVPSKTDDGKGLVYTVLAESEDGIPFTLWVVHPDNAAEFVRTMVGRLKLTVYLVQPHQRGGYVVHGAPLNRVWIMK